MRVADRVGTALVNALRAAAVALPLALAAASFGVRAHAQVEPGEIAIVPDAEVHIARAEVGRWVGEGEHTRWFSDAACGPAPCVVPMHVPGDELRLEGRDGESSVLLERADRATARVHTARWIGLSDALIASGATALGLAAAGLLVAYFGYLAPCQLGADSPTSCALFAGFGWGGLGTAVLGSGLLAGGAFLRSSTSDQRVTLQPLPLASRGAGAMLALRF